MKIYILSPDASGRRDGTNQAQLLQNFYTVDSIAFCDMVVIPISYWADFKFNPELLKLNRPYVLIDYIEFCWDASDKENRLGAGMTRTFSHINSDEWAKFDDWVRDNPPAMTFKRELQEKHETETVLPIEFLCYLPIPPIQTKAEFDSRPFDWINVFGYSHPDRVRLHGETFIAMGSCGLNVISDWSQFENLPLPLPPKSVISIYSPWWVRQPMSVVMHWQQQAKISVSMPGAGFKSFRTAESPIGAIMAQPENELAWSYPWTHWNSIVLAKGEELDFLIAASGRSMLYELYVNSQENIRNYECVRYTNEWVLGNIARIL